MHGEESTMYYEEKAAAYITAQQMSDPCGGGAEFSHHAAEGDPLGHWSSESTANSPTYIQ